MKGRIEDAGQAARPSRLPIGGQPAEMVAVAIWEPPGVWLPTYSGEKDHSQNLDFPVLSIVTEFLSQELL